MRMIKKILVVGIMLMMLMSTFIVSKADVNDEQAVTSADLVQLIQDKSCKIDNKDDFTFFLEKVGQDNFPLIKDVISSMNPDSISTSRFNNNFGSIWMFKKYNNAFFRNLITVISYDSTSKKFSVNILTVNDIKDKEDIKKYGSIMDIQDTSDDNIKTYYNSILNILGNNQEILDKSYRDVTTDIGNWVSDDDNADECVKAISEKIDKIFLNKHSILKSDDGRWIGSVSCKIYTKDGELETFITILQ